METQPRQLFMNTILNIFRVRKMELFINKWPYLLTKYDFTVRGLLYLYRFASSLLLSDRDHVDVIVLTCVRIGYSRVLHE
jgi:hypothetical protein